jgi:DNA polymerase-1
MYRPARMGNGIEIWGVDQVKEKFQIENPLQVIDYLGMMGDAVDNIPGLPGVGDKTAKKFLQAYGSMEGLFENSHELKGKMREKVEANQELGLLSKELATIILDCPVNFDADSFKMSQPNHEATAEIFSELEFRRLADRVKQLFPDASGAKAKNEEGISIKVNQSNDPQLDLFSAGSGDIATPSKNVKDSSVYQIIDSDFALNLLLKTLNSQNQFSFFLLSSEGAIMDASPLGIAISINSGASYYIPFSGNNQGYLNKLKPLLEDENITKTGHGLKEQYKVLSNHGITLKGPLFDTLIAHYLINPDLRHNLSLLSQTYLNIEITDIAELVGKGKNKELLENLPLEKLSTYAGERSDVIQQLSHPFKKELNRDDLAKLFYDIEMPLMKVLGDMELEGIALDVPYLQELAKELNSDIDNLEEEIYKAAGESFNIASPKQLGIVLFETLKLVDKPKKTKTGQYATSEDILRSLEEDHEIISKILSYRGLVKLKNTYVDALPEEVNSRTNRIHTTYEQAVASTGRLSSTKPNLQNIPIRTERGKLVRKAFVAANNNYELMAADYSQIELRLIAAMSGDQNMIDAFLKGEDIHKSTAAKVFETALEEVTREQRSQAKTVNFGIIYGVSAHGLSQQTNLSRKESKALIDAYYLSYPSLKSYMDKQVNVARDQGYVETLLHRRRYLKNINSRNAIVRSADERNAINAPIQGSAADIIKIAMIKIHEFLKEGNYKTKMLLQVHDELVFDLHKDEAEALQPRLKSFMEEAFKLPIPLAVDLDRGENWLDAH